MGGAETDPKLISKALYALGTLVRGCDICLEEFVASQVFFFSKALYALGTLVRGCDICLEEFVASQVC